MPEQSPRYRTIVADPPWDLNARSGDVSRVVPYPTMPLEAIKALPVKAMADNIDTDAHLYLWTVNAYLRDAFDVARGWGFWPAQVIVWAKPGEFQRIGGAWPSNVEFVLFCRRPKVTSRPDVLALTTQVADAAERNGITRKDVDAHMGTSDMAGWWLSRIETRCACPTDEQWPRLRDFVGASRALDAEVTRINAAKGTAERQKLARAPSSWFTWPRGEHSAKPEAFLDHVESVSPGPYLEMFARRNRLGWETWGNEALEHVDLGEAA